MKFVAAGDMLIQRHIPNYEGFEAIRSWIATGEARFFNLETTVNEEGTCFGYQAHGGSYLRVSPDYLDDCKKFGFNMVSVANNHAMDFGHNGLVQTCKFVRESGLVSAGSGMNLDEASAPSYLDLKDGRVALIGFTSSIDNTGIAGRQSRRVMGRPGVNQLRFTETLGITHEQMEILKQLAEETGVNNQRNITVREGYKPADKDGEFTFGTMLFRETEKPCRMQKCNAADLKRAADAIYEAKMQADFTLVSIHSHQPGNTSKEEPSFFLQEFARYCIDQGADAVIGHGPHLLRPIEIYKGKPIFYSLGDFVMQNENIPYMPEDYFTSYGLNSDATMHELFRTRSKDFTRGLQTQKIMFQTVLPRWEIENGKMTKLELLPVQLTWWGTESRSRVGLPQVDTGGEILRHLEEMSAPFGTKFEIHDGIARVILD